LAAKYLECSNRRAFLCASEWASKSWIQRNNVERKKANAVGGITTLIKKKAEKGTGKGGRLVETKGKERKKGIKREKERANMGEKTAYRRAYARSNANVRIGARRRKKVHVHRQEGRIGTENPSKGSALLGSRKPQKAENETTTVWGGKEKRFAPADRSSNKGTGTIKGKGDALGGQPERHGCAVERRWGVLLGQACVKGRGEAKTMR